MSRWLAALAALTLTAGSSSVLVTPPAPATPGARAYLRIAVVGDTQNYLPLLATNDSHADPAYFEHDRKGARQLAALVNAIIQWRPDLVIIAGDLTASTGGVDQNDNMRIGDDPDLSIYSPPDKEWPFFRREVYDKFRAAGLPVFIIVGNHDSCFEFERWFPKTEWDALPYAYASLSRADLCGPDADPPNPSPDTTHRAALIETPIGPLCLIGGPTSIADWSAGDGGWVESNTGCGGSYPTIAVKHTGSPDPDHAMAFEAGGLILAWIYGHVVPNSSVQGRDLGGNLDKLHLVINTQELGAVAGCPLACPTGDAYWTQWVIDPVANTTTIRQVNAERPGDPGAAGAVNSTLQLQQDFCATFGGPACP